MSTSKERVSSVCAVAVLSLFLAGCGESSFSDGLFSVCRVLGICDQAPPEPVAVDVVCDASLGSSCTRDGFESNLEEVLRWASSRPGSVVRVWALGASVGETRIVGEQTVPRASKRGAKARQEHEKRFALAAKFYLLKSAEPLLGKADGRRSPLLESLTKVALAQSRAGFERYMVVISDAREFSAFGDFECGPLLNVRAFLGMLQKNKVLTPGSLQGAKLYFANVTMGEVHNRRCVVSMQREVAIRELWRAALVGAGAAEVQFSNGTAQLRN